MVNDEYCARSELLERKLRTWLKKMKDVPRRIQELERCWKKAQAHVVHILGEYQELAIEFENMNGRSQYHTEECQRAHAELERVSTSRDQMQTSYRQLQSMYQSTTAELSLRMAEVS